MLDSHELQLTLTADRAKLAPLQAALKIDTLSNYIEELEARSQEEGFWTDIAKATALQKELTDLKKQQSAFLNLGQQLDDLQVGLDLAEVSEANEQTELLEEVQSGLKDWQDAYTELQLETLFTDKLDDKNTILTLHAGAGGTEAQDWVLMLYRMYTRFAEKMNFTCKELNLVEGEEAGIKSVSFSVSGPHAYGWLKSEHGVHRLVRISPFDASGRRHTSFASCEVLPELDKTIEITIRPEDLRVDTYRSTGKGGQHVNKTDSAVRLTHLPTGIVAACQAERSQIQNRETAMKMLQAKLYKLALEQQKASIDDLKGEQLDIAWGSQIRSYVFCPYTLVKDHRTEYEDIDVEGVMDGNLKPFVYAYLQQKAGLTTCKK
ncbi:peptide chain release factor 2 [Amygdalobacter nucleatus]|uniref:Peptide chain release factor 2 n=1 Tax=Amygdalobacter nucleatus TaxID=3029274 RepID=A0A133YH03_9FIRM|nr:peptide chain release factor 2 [Amygdalobacter nucleatus]KXB42478.1 peptide chain release factor 2 [Amygdalobacter nucleatus]MDF0486052.1 peptide chain release factor 2 [Amygdalobacter nucleatus]WEG37392.1 peptide chain release factor 2 [Amygdalobacter nucleatus]